MVQLNSRTVAILLAGFDAAGDGGIDPIYDRERKEVEAEIGPHLRPMLKDLMREIRLETEDKHGYIKGDPRSPATKLPPCPMHITTALGRNLYCENGPLGHEGTCMGERSEAAYQRLLEASRK